MVRLPPNRRSRGSSRPSHSRSHSRSMPQTSVQSESNESPNASGDLSRNRSDVLLGSSASCSSSSRSSAAVLAETLLETPRTSITTRTQIQRTVPTSSLSTSLSSSSPTLANSNLSPPNGPIRLHRPPRLQQAISPVRLQYEDELDNCANQEPLQVDENAENITEKLKRFMTQQIAFNEQLMNAVQERPEAGQLVERGKIRLPKIITAAVRDTYRNLQGQNDQTLTWDLSKSFMADENKEINRMIMDGVRSTEKETPAKIIKAAMRVYFRTKKREHVIKAQKLDKVVQKRQRIRSRRNTKRLLRKKALEESTSITPENKTRYAQVMTAGYISSEHTASDDQQLSDAGTSGLENEEPSIQGRKFAVGKLPWRSNEVNKLMTVLDAKIARKRGLRGSGMVFQRIRGTVSTRVAPLDGPDWAINGQ